MFFHIIHRDGSLIVPCDTAECYIQCIFEPCGQELHPVIICEDVFSHLFEICQTLGPGQRIGIIIERITFRCAFFHKAKRQPLYVVLDEVFPVQCWDGGIRVVEEITGVREILGPLGTVWEISYDILVVAVSCSECDEYPGLGNGRIRTTVLLEEGIEPVSIIGAPFGKGSSYITNVNIEVTKDGSKYVYTKDKVLLVVSSYNGKTLLAKTWNDNIYNV